MTTKDDRLSTSLAEDLCYAVINGECIIPKHFLLPMTITVTNGECIMPKHFLLPMTIRHLTGSAEVITIINRYGHGQSNTKTLELETALCNSVMMSESVLPENISADNNVGLHMCWDNFDLNEKTPSGSGTSHLTRGIAIQEITSPDTSSGVVIPSVDSQSTVPTKQRTI